MIKSITSNSGFTVVFEDGPLMIHRSSPNYKAAADALAAQDITRLRYLLDPRGALRVYSEDSISIADNGKLRYNGEDIGEFCQTLLEKSMSASISWRLIEPLFKSWTSNPSNRALEELDAAMVSMDFPVTTDGGILAHKVVLPTYVDPDTQKHICSVGKTISVPREAVSRDGRAGSERGFIAGAADYLSSNTILGNTLLVKIMPEDVVGVFSRPCRQILCSKFQVIAENNQIMLFSLYDEKLKPLLINN